MRPSRAPHGLEGCQQEWLHGWLGSDKAPCEGARNRCAVWRAGHSEPGYVFPSIYVRVSNDIGGPSGSGVSQVLTDGKRIQGIVDSDAADTASNRTATGAKYFDIVSFDPRGINNTTPPFTCFQDPAARNRFLLQKEAEGMLGSSELAFDTFWARATAVGTSCSQDADSKSKGEAWIGEHMNTPPVVADMVELIERLGEWREKEADTLLRSRTVPDDKAILRTRWKKGQEKLLYWGISYGSVLGMTFAAMHPDRVQRVVVDGVLDAPDYYAGNWLKNIQDADHAFNAFFEYCHEAGPTGCALAGGSPEDIKTRVDELIESLKTNPVAVPGSATRPPDIITYTDVKTTIKTAIYQPVQLFGLLAGFLADLSQNNGSSFADFKYQSAAGSCPGPDQPANVVGDNRFDSQASIICTDGLSIDGISKDKYRRYWQTLRGQSKTIGDEWAQVRMPCNSWKARPAWRFDGE